MYQWILFDLDGTLTDPGEGITNSVAYALEKWNIKVQDRTELYPFIGPPLKDSFEKYYGFTDVEAEQAVEYYREYYREKGIFENKLIPGIAELLAEIHDSGRKIMLATSKPELFAKSILEHFGIAEYFDFIGGASMDGSRTKKTDVILYVLEKCNIKAYENVVMIGDRKYDIEGAKQAGLDSIGVLFGYGDHKELAEAGATYIVEKPEDILNVLCHNF